ncbi:site-2 protease family protein [candidate division KSB1 bacterium]|nr:site-2 protease family protein [candidate division KSB1 bacterium]
MFGRQIRLFKILGFDVSIDFSWVIIAVLITWSLATGLFPTFNEGFSTSTYWLMGIGGALGLFVSIVFHEFSHSIVARRMNVPMKGITLFIFGGVAQMKEEPGHPKAELWMAIAGPIASIFLAGLFYVMEHIGTLGTWPAPMTAVFHYLWLINLLLAAFNLVPAFPLDGGRVLRSILWLWKNDLSWATRIASSVGSIFGTFLILMGLFTLIMGDFISGLWWMMIGLFLRSVSRASYRQVLIRKTLKDESLADLMNADPITVEGGLALDELVEDYFYKYHHSMFPVVENNRLVGYVTPEQVKGIPRNEWPDHTVKEIALHCDNGNTVSVNTPADKALQTMQSNNKSRLLVVDKLIVEIDQEVETLHQGYLATEVESLRLRRQALIDTLEGYRDELLAVLTQTGSIKESNWSDFAAESDSTMEKVNRFIDVLQRKRQPDPVMYPPFK